MRRESILIFVWVRQKQAANIAYTTVLNILLQVTSNAVEKEPHFQS
ncbi:hypothetical protein HHA04nite_32260 [Halomonas halophila]|uniref:Uncharacterized protein n=1 Tax=Halomonas halophila TaxID=29573 RepID=A0ABQ0U8A9_9GAMM|nr:hypothetical protein HHA04nite_32260 [Halomonas halophila]